MKINSAISKADGAEFGQLMPGDIFSNDDYSGLYLKVDDRRAYAFDSEGFFNFAPFEEVVKREISITVEDGLPYQE